MHHAMTIGTQQREVSEFGFVARLQRMQRLGVVNVNHPFDLRTIGFTEVETAGFALKHPVLLEKVILFAFDDFFVSFPNTVHASQDLTFLGLEEARIIRNA